MKKIILRLIRSICLFWMRRKGCEVSEGSIINGLPYIRRKGSGRIILGEGVTINSARWSNWLSSQGAMNLSVEDGAILELKAGAGVSSSQLVANVGIEIGENSFIGAGCLICDSDMHEVPLGSAKPIKMSPIKIGRGVFIGARCIILKGVTIGDGAVIGAGSVITQNVLPNSLMVGNPPVIMRNNLA